MNSTAHAVWALVVHKTGALKLHLVPPACPCPGYAGGSYTADVVHTRVAPTGGTPYIPETLAEEMAIDTEHGWLPTQNVGSPKGK